MTGTKRLYWFDMTPGHSDHMGSAGFDSGVVEATPGEIESFIADVNARHPDVVWVRPLKERVTTFADFRDLVGHAVAVFHRDFGQSEICPEDRAFLATDDLDDDPWREVASSSLSLGSQDLARMAMQEERRRAREDELADLAESDPMRWLDRKWEEVKIQAPPTPEILAGQAAMILAIQERWWSRASMDDAVKLGRRAIEELYPTDETVEAVGRLEYVLLDQRRGAQDVLDWLEAEAYRVADRRFLRTKPMTAAEEGGAPAS